MTDDLTPQPATSPEPPEAELLDTSAFRLSDRQALAVLAGYLVFRAITQRVGLAMLPSLLDSAPWAIPLLNNSLLPLITVGTEVRDDRAMLAAVGAASLFLSFVAGLFLYWAGWRFGPKLAEKAKEAGSFWAGIWNPKQIERAHGWIENWGFLAVALTRASEILLVPVALVAGLTRMSLRKYLAAYGLGAVAFASLTLWLGGRAGDAWPWLPDRIKSWSNIALWVGLGLLALMVLGFAANRPNRRT